MLAVLVVLMTGFGVFNMPILESDFSSIRELGNDIVLTNSSNLFSNFTEQIEPTIGDVLSINNVDYLITSLSAVSPYSGTLFNIVDNIRVSNNIILHIRFPKKLRVFVQPRTKLIIASAYIIDENLYVGLGNVVDVNEFPGIKSTGLWRVSYKNYGVSGRQRIFYELLKCGKTINYGVSIGGDNDP